jgi:hypothetical protein
MRSLAFICFILFFFSFFFLVVAWLTEVAQAVGLFGPW